MMKPDNSNEKIERTARNSPYFYTLLGYDSPVEFPNWRGLICEEVGGYIERTERFKETKDENLASQWIFFSNNLFKISL